MVFNLTIIYLSNINNNLKGLSMKKNKKTITLLVSILTFSFGILSTNKGYGFLATDGYFYNNIVYHQAAPLPLIFCIISVVCIFEENNRSLSQELITTPSILEQKGYDQKTIDILMESQNYFINKFQKAQKKLIILPTDSYTSIKSEIYEVAPKTNPQYIDYLLEQYGML